jgi:hypothetical protein
MIKEDEQKLMHILSDIPSTTPQDRLYVHTDGTIRVDYLHPYAGSVGRRIMDSIVGGHNRQTIISYIARLVDDVVTVSRRCALTLDMPYAIGNLRTFGLHNGDILHYRTCLRTLRTGIIQLRALTRTLCLVYTADRVIYTRISQVIVEIENANTLIQPIEHLALTK